MANWEFLKGFGSGVIVVSAVIFFFAKGIAALKSLWPDRAKPQLLEPSNCGIMVTPLDKEVHCILLVNNAGSKNCSIISVNLKSADGFNIRTGYGSSTPLPKTISKDSTEKVVIKGSVPLKELPIQPTQKSIDIKVVIEFDTKHIIEKTIAFTISHYVNPAY